METFIAGLEEVKRFVPDAETTVQKTRPHSSLNDLTPEEFVNKEQKKLQLNLVQSMG